MNWNVPIRLRAPIRFVLIGFLVTTSLLWLWGGSSSASSLRGVFGPRVPPQIEIAYLNNSRIDLNITQWGEMGTRVKLLAQWADYVVNHPREDLRHFEAALSQQFPFLVNTSKTVYTPWSRRPVNTFTSEVGFVVCAGSGNYQFAAHLITSLRRVHGVKAPIEIAYTGDDDLRPEHRTFLRELETDISFIDLLERFPNATDDLVGSGWAMKPFSLLASAHEKVILVDADAIFLTPPDIVFDANPGLVETGTLFFHDRPATGTENWRDRLVFVKAQLEAGNITPSRHLQNESLFYSGDSWYEADSGVVILDKSRSDVLLGLIFATWMNTRTVRDEVTYQVFHGDKETFWFAMELSGFDYYFHPLYAGTMGTIEGDASTKSDDELATEAMEICGTHMLHLDQNEELPFWINGGIYELKDDLSRGYAKMTHYWVGSTQDIRDSEPQWYWHDGNIGCVQQMGIKSIPESIQKNLAAIVAEATKVDESIRLLQDDDGDP